MCASDLLKLCVRCFSGAGAHAACHVFSRLPCHATPPAILQVGNVDDFGFDVDDGTTFSASSSTCCYIDGFGTGTTDYAQGFSCIDVDSVGDL